MKIETNFSVDPKNDNFFSYKNVDLFKPNLNEINTSMKTQARHSDINKLKQNINELKSKIKSDNIILTIGKNGILYTDEKKIKHSKAHKVKTIDPSGAGDVIISITSLLIRSGIKLEKVMKIAKIEALFHEKSRENARKIAFFPGFVNFKR